MGIIALGASILDALIFGYKSTEEDGTPLPVRTILNFIGATLTDDPTNKATIVNIPGVLGAGLPFVIEGASAPIAAGQWFTTAPGATTVTLATSASLALMPGVLGIAMNGGSAGATILGNTEQHVPNSITGLGAGVASRVRLNVATGRCERVSTFSTSDYPLGVCNAGGDLLIVTGILMQLFPAGAITAGDAAGSSYPSFVNSFINGTAIPAGGALTTGNVPIVSGIAAMTYGQLDLSNANSVKNTLPVARLPVNASGVAGTDGTNKVALANVHNAIIESGTCGDAASTSDPSWASTVDTFSTPSYVDSGTYVKTVTAALAIGDIIEIEGRYVTEIGSATTLQLRVVLLDGSNSEVLCGCFFNSSATNLQNQTGDVIPIFARYVMTSAMSAGTCTIKVQGQRPTGSGAAILLNCSGFKYRVIRP